LYPEQLHLQPFEVPEQLPHEAVAHEVHAQTPLLKPKNNIKTKPKTTNNLFTID
jgi:hypothetical protein